MKKIVLAALAASTMFATPAFAQSTDATIIFATIPLVCNVDGPGNQQVALGSETALANLTATCNNAAGFTFGIASQNNFRLIDQNNAANATFYSYSLSLSSPLGSVANISTNQTINSAPGSNAAIINGTTAAVSVEVAGPTGAPFAGTYQDTITWTITPNA